MRELIGIWAALGVVLSGATQLRIGGFPIGPAEGLLVAWMMFCALLLLSGVRFSLGHVFWILTSYWLAALGLLGLGATVAVMSDEFVPADAAHDALAFVYMSLMTALLALRMLDTPEFDYHLNIGRMVFVFQTLFAIVLFAAAHTSATPAAISPWYGVVRFRGWAENPNQMAFAMAAMPFLGWYLMRETSGRLRKLAYLLGISSCLWIGIATKSDGLRVAWLAAFAAIGGLLWLRAIARGRARWLPVTHLLVPVMIILGGLLYGPAIVDYAYQVGEVVYDEYDQGAKRIFLWTTGLHVISQSPLVGFGPGKFSGAAGPFSGGEAHNSFIDWGMSTGGLGVLLHVALLGWCVWRTARSTSFMPLAMLTSIVVFSVFSYMLRHPMYWLLLVLCLMLSERRSPAGIRSSAQVAHRVIGLREPAGAGVGSKATLAIERARSR